MSSSQEDACETRRNERDRESETEEEKRARGTIEMLEIGLWPEDDRCSLLLTEITCFKKEPGYEARPYIRLVIFICGCSL